MSQTEQQRALSAKRSYSVLIVAAAAVVVLESGSGIRRVPLLRRRGTTVHLSLPVWRLLQRRLMDLQSSVGQRDVVRNLPRRISGAAVPLHAVLLLLMAIMSLPPIFMLLLLLLLPVEEGSLRVLPPAPLCLCRGLLLLPLRWVAALLMMADAAAGVRDETSHPWIMRVVVWAGSTSPG